MLQAFLAVAESGSFSLAAQQLYLTQPAVSKRIAALEADLGVPLFERLSKQVILTEAGRMLWPRARSIVQEMADCRQVLTDLGGGAVSGVLQLATSHHIGLHRLPAVLRQYSLAYPQVELALRFMDSEQGCAAVAAGSLEMAVVTLPREPVARLELRKIWEDPLAVMVSRTHPLASEGEGRLLAYPAIVPERGTETRRLIDASLLAAGLHFRTGVETNYLETIRMLVMAGLGWSVLPLSMHNEELVCMAVSGVAVHRQLGLVLREGATLSRAAQAFAELLQTAGA